MNDTLIEYLYEIMENYSEQAWEYGALKKAIEALKPVEDGEVKAVLSAYTAPRTRNLIERLAREKAEAEQQRDEALQWMRCELSGNPCGTDTHAIDGAPCCRTCVQWESIRAALSQEGE